MVRSLIDTNVLIYSFGADAKAEIAQAVLRQGSLVDTQVRIVNPFLA